MRDGPQGSLATMPASMVPVSSDSVNGWPSGATAPSTVPPSRSSIMPPTVTSAERPAPFSQSSLGLAVTL